MKVLSRSEVLTVPEGVRTSRSRLGEFPKRSRAKVAPWRWQQLPSASSSCPASGWSRYWEGPFPTASSRQGQAGLCAYL